MRPETLGKSLYWIVILQPVSSTFAYRYDPWYRADTLRPVDAITDTVNDLGIKILQQYTAHGNVAFSPMGIAFVLTVLYEGSAGRSNKQIADAMELPLNRDITRIGFRDIHRRLRSYLNADGFLGGLMLSKENTRLRSEYEEILRFYGFDLLSMEQEANVTISMENSNTTEPSTMTSMNMVNSVTMRSSMGVKAIDATTQNAQITSTSVADSLGIIRSTLMTQLTTDSSSMVISDENVPPSTDAESMMDHSLTINTELTSTSTSVDSQTNSNMVTVTVLTDDQNSQVSSIAIDNVSSTENILLSTSTDTQATLTPTATSVAVNRNTITRPANSLTAITSNESIRPSLFADAESMADSLSMSLSTSIGSTSTTFMDQTSLNMTAIADDQLSNQNPQMFSMINTIETTEAVANIVPTTNVMKVSNTSVPTSDAKVTIVLTNGNDTTASTGIENEISFAGKVSTTTNIPNPNFSLTIDTGAPATTIKTIDMVFFGASATDTFNTSTPMSTGLNSTGTTISTSDMITNRDINLKSDTETSMMANTAEVATLKDLTTKPFVTDVNSTTIILMDETTMTASVKEVNFTSSDPFGNSAIANSTTNSVLENQTVINSTMNSTLVDINQTPINQNTVSPNRVRRTIGNETTELESTSNSAMINNITITSGINRAWTNRLNGPNKLNIQKRRSLRGYFSSYPDEGIWMQDLEIWKSHDTRSSDSSTDTTAEVPFLVNGCDVSSVSASRYIAVLPFAYFPSLHAVALEFPLDDPRYNIILLMPTDKTDAYRLARDLNGKSLRSLRKRLQPTWVRATIPSFMLRGFVTLTSFLQRLGISDVFDPRAADLSPMTSDLGVYARDIQQSIGISIRNYMKPDRIHSRESSNIVQPRRDYYRYLFPGNGLFERAGPVPFTALHPFLYFIIDTQTSVSLIAGRVNDPLNSRIL